MRLVGLTLTAALLSGCSWLGGAQGGGFGPGNNAYYGAPQSGPADPCQVAHARAPIPRGCAPHQVTLGTGNVRGGFAQQPQFGQPAGAQFANGGYGSHAQGNAHAGHGLAPKQSRKRKPRFRGQLDLGLEQSIGGNLLDYGKFDVDPTVGYDPYIYAEGSTEGSRAEGAVTTNNWYGDNRLDTGLADNVSNARSQARTFSTGDNVADGPDYDEIRSPGISFDDAWSAPTTIGLGGEYIMNRATLFARAGYTRAQGNAGDVVNVEGTVYQDVYVDEYDITDGFPYLGSTASSLYDTEHDFAVFSYDFSDMERIDLEAGGRYYLNPISGQRTGKTVTPFIGGSAGASRYNDVSFKIDQRQLSYSSVFEEGDLEYYDVDIPGGYDIDNDPTTASVTNVALYDSQWVPSGRLSAGVEWQVTPKTALAFETGLRVEGARDYANGVKGDTNVSVPMTLRGSFNF